MEEFDEVYRLYASDVYRYIMALSRNEALAKDILQNTMLKAFTTANKFRGECTVKTWLCSIAKNEYLNSIRRVENKNFSLDEAVNTIDENIEHRFSDRFQALEIHRILHELDEPYKEIFSLRVFAELKFSDIGSIFGKSENWARVTFYRAKEKIIKLLKEQEE
ncbi:MAG: sigma-70 family RNA polymerase sigma factor [Ruminococcus sp.]|nr:sigma-70 family RNA polymerase sigma factor [Ruminococcus sp.]